MAEPVPLTPQELAFRYGSLDCYQDRCENVPFVSVGGLEKRAELELPRWITEHGESYLRGYRVAALELFGEDWRTCEFGWKRALVINERELVDSHPRTDRAPRDT